MSLYTSDLLIGSFRFAFLSLEITTVLCYFLAFYLLLWSWTKLSFRKKIIISFIFSISLPQYFTFLHSIRKQFFDWIFFLLFLGIFPRCKNVYHQVILGIIFAETFFAHRWVSFYLVILLPAILLYWKKGKDIKHLKKIFIALIIWLAINISYLTPFIKIQSKLILNLFLNPIKKGVWTALSSSDFSAPSAVKAYWFDLFQSVAAGNPFLNYFIWYNILFLIIISWFWKIKKHLFMRYFILLNICIYLVLTMAWRVSHMTNMVWFLLFALVLARKRFIAIIAISYIIFTSMQTIALTNIKNHYFGVIDSFMQDFYNKVPTKKTFLFSAWDNLFIRYSGYNSVENFIKTSLKSSYEEYYENGQLSSYLSQFEKYFILSWYNQVVLPEMLEWYDIYVVFGLYYSWHVKNMRYSLSFPSSTPIEKLFAQSPLFEPVSINGFKDYRNQFQWAKYPISFVFRLKPDAPRTYVPNDEILFEVKKNIYNIHR